MDGSAKALLSFWFLVSVMHRKGWVEKEPGAEVGALLLRQRGGGSHGIVRLEDILKFFFTHWLPSQLIRHAKPEPRHWPPQKGQH